MDKHKFDPAHWGQNTAILLQAYFLQKAEIRLIKCDKKNIQKSKISIIYQRRKWS